jgi:hypothetical protein
MAEKSLCALTLRDSYLERKLVFPLNNALIVFFQRYGDVRLDLFSMFQRDCIRAPYRKDLHLINNDICNSTYLDICFLGGNDIAARLFLESFYSRQFHTHFVDFFLKYTFFKKLPEQGDCSLFDSLLRCYHCSQNLSFLYKKEFKYNYSPSICFVKEEKVKGKNQCFSCSRILTKRDFSKREWRREEDDRLCNNCCSQQKKKETLNIKTEDLPHEGFANIREFPNDNGKKFFFTNESKKRLSFSFFLQKKFNLLAYKPSEIPLVSCLKDEGLGGFNPYGNGQYSSEVFFPKEFNSLDEKKTLFYSNLACPVCFLLFEDPIILTCGHSFCTSCFYSFSCVKRECPTCRSSFSKNFVPAKNYSLCDSISFFNTFLLVKPSAPDRLPACVCCEKFINVTHNIAYCASCYDLRQGNVTLPHLPSCVSCSKKINVKNNIAYCMSCYDLKKIEEKENSTNNDSVSVPSVKRQEEMKKCSSCLLYLARALFIKKEFKHVKGKCNGCISESKKRGKQKNFYKGIGMGSSCTSAFSQVPVVSHPNSLDFGPNLQKKSDFQCLFCTNGLSSPEYGSFCKSCYEYFVSVPVSREEQGNSSKWEPDVIDDFDYKFKLNSFCIKDFPVYDTWSIGELYAPKYECSIIWNNVMKKGRGFTDGKAEQAAAMKILQHFFVL